jgi:hypothetical protein
MQDDVGFFLKIVCKTFNSGYFLQCWEFRCSVVDECKASDFRVSGLKGVQDV